MHNLFAMIVRQLTQNFMILGTKEGRRSEGQHPFREMEGEAAGVQLQPKPIDTITSINHRCFHGP